MSLSEHARTDAGVARRTSLAPSNQPSHGEHQNQSCEAELALVPASKCEIPKPWHTSADQEQTDQPALLCGRCIARAIGHWALCWRRPGPHLFVSHAGLSFANEDAHAAIIETSNYPLPRQESVKTRSSRPRPEDSLLFAGYAEACWGSRGQHLDVPPSDGLRLIAWRQWYSSAGARSAREDSCRSWPQGCASRRARAPGNARCC